MNTDALPPVPIHAQMDGAAFQTLYAAQRPAVLKGHVTHWPVVAAASQGANQLVTFLKGFDAGLPAIVSEAPAATRGHFFYGDDLADYNFVKRQNTVSAALDTILAHAGKDDAPVTALQMIPLDSHLPGFQVQHPSPLLPPQITPRLWAGNRTISQTHNDADHNIACVVAGRRRFVLFPPDQVGNLYIGPFDRAPPLSLVRLDDPDFTRFPRFREALTHAVVADLEPGDALFIPQYWWHHVSALDDVNVLVNYWWGREAGGIDSAYNLFQTALLSVKDLPTSQKAYWRAMFATYVFGEGGADHIPPHLRGPLGAMGPDMRRQLKNDLKQALLKN